MANGSNPTAPQTNGDLENRVRQGLDAEYRHRYPGAFAATDIHAMLVLPGGEIATLGQLAALSISTHRDTFPVTAMGTVSARGFTQGHRTVAGTLIFHTIDVAAFAFRGNSWRSRPDAGQGGAEWGASAADELPLFDVHLTYVNDVGMVSYESLYGVRLLDFGKTVSLENLHPVESYSYMALDYVPLRPLISGDSVAKIQLTRAQDKQKLLWAGDGPTQFQPLVLG